MNTTAELTPITITVEHPTAAALARPGAAALELVEAFAVVDDATYTLAGEELQAIQKRAATLDAQRKVITKPMDDAKRAVMDLFRAPVETLEQAAGILKRKMLEYSTEQQRKAREQQLAAERAAQQERERLEAEAQALKAEGRAGEAAVKEQVAAMVVAAPAPVPAAAPKVAGVKTTTTVDFEVVDLLALVQHVAQHPELVNLIVADSTKLRAYVRGLGMATALPGVRVFEKNGIAAARK
jgi:hypothetical protein